MSEQLRVFNSLNQIHNLYLNTNLKVIKVCGDLVKELIFSVEKKSSVRGCGLYLREDVTVVDVVS